MDLSVRNQTTDPLVVKHVPTGGTIVNNENPLASLEAVAKEAQAKILLIMTEEAYAEAWKALENWLPSEHKTPAENVKDLKERYLALKNYILKSADQAQQALLLAQLDGLVTQHLVTLLDGPYGELVAFLVSNKQDLAAAAIQKSLLLFVLGGSTRPPEPSARQEGRRTQPQAAGPAAAPPQNKAASQAGDRFQPGAAENQIRHTQGQQARGPLARGVQAQPAAGGDAAADHGMVQYGPDGKKNGPVQGEQSPPKTGYTDARASGVVLSYAPKRNSVEALFPKPFTLVELEKSTAFAKHMSKYGGSGPLTPAQVEKEEWIGMRAGVSWLKGQLFAKVDGVGKGAAQMMQNTIEVQISTSMRQATAALKSGAAFGTPGGQSFAPLEQDAVFSAYHHVVHSFSKNHDAVATLLGSLRFTGELVKKKEKDPAYQKMVRYQDRFHGQGKPGESVEFKHETISWLQQLREGWNQFVKDMGLRRDLALDSRRFQALSGLWASTMAPAHVPDRTPKASAMTALGWCAVGAAVVTLALMLWGH